MKSINVIKVLNVIATLALMLLIILALVQLIDWGVIKASFTGRSASDCHQGGACWALVANRWDQFVFGFYPTNEQYRVIIALTLIGIAFVNLVMRYLSLWKRFIISFLAMICSVALLHGRVLGLSVVPTDQWGGLFLTLFLSFASIFVASPVSLLLALGRRSELSIVRSLCITFIETIRGVPLISVLFMASVMLPFFLPQGMHIDKLLRAFIGLTLFQSAYLAEVIRGGLNAIDKGQIEAGKALGMHYWQIMAKIVLPQAMVLMIPGIVNSYIALFKDTTLVLIIGLYDFLGIVQAAITDPSWLGLALEAYIFCAAVYWFFCFGMSLYSKHLEKKLKIRL